MLLQATTASGYFEVQILSLTNNRGTLVDGRCCGGGGRGGKGEFPSCTTPCSTAFWLCLKEYQSNVTAIGSCSFGNVSSHALGPNTFTLTDPVTLQLHFTFRWTVSGYFAVCTSELIFFLTINYLHFSLTVQYKHRVISYVKNVFASKFCI